MSSIRTTVYGTFRGADFSTDPSLVEKSRSPLCTNIWADAGGMPEKRPGWRMLQELSGTVYGLFSLEGELLAHVGDKLYRWTENAAQAPAALLSGLTEHKSRGVSMGGKLWIVTGGEYICYDGQTASRDFTCYVPTILIAKSPAGGGTPYEDVNLLTPYRKESFQTDGESRVFHLAGSIDQSGTVTVRIDGETQSGGYSVDRAAGTVTFDSAPAAPEAGSADRVEIEYPHTVEGYRATIDGCSIIGTYGIGGDNRLTLSGNPAYPNRDWISGFKEPTYFPDRGYSVLGSEESAIMGYCRIGSYQGIVKEDKTGEATVFFRSGEIGSDGEALFTTRQALSGVGAVAPGSFGNLLDDPLFLGQTGVFGVSISDMSGQRVSQNRSWFLNAKLREENLREAEAAVWNGLYLLAFSNGHVYVLDARQEKSYRSAALGDFVYEAYYWENIPAVCWLSLGEALYLGTADGKLCRLNSDDHTVNRYNDNGEAISAVWATKYDDDGTPGYFKTLMKKGCCVTLKPAARSSGTVYFRTDRTEGTEKAVATDTMDIFSFDDIDFARFTFSSDDGPQEIFFNHKEKNYKRLQIIVRNAVVNEGFGVYQITKFYVVGNFAKGRSKSVSSESDLASDEQVELSFRESYEEIFGAGSWEGESAD
ncbi:MAG: hypothetical protein KBS46_05855 [Clostridiales bacterium]|nr:hypothetical protein [Candidatus Apopatocola equi]